MAEKKNINPIRDKTSKASDGYQRKPISNGVNIKKITLRFKNVLEKQGLPIEKMVIFGSYAKNKANIDSDIDICVVSPKFGKDSIEELQFLLKQRREVDARIEPFPVSSEEYKKTASPLIFEIKKFGKEIKPC